MNDPRGPERGVGPGRKPTIDNIDDIDDEDGLTSEDRREEDDLTLHEADAGDVLGPPDDPEEDEGGEDEET